MMKTKMWVASVGVIGLAAAGLALGIAAPASAHNATLSGSAVCDAADGTALITWSVDNDWAQTATVSASTDAAIPNGSVIAAAAQNNGSKITTFTEKVAAPAAGKTIDASFTATWSDAHVVSGIHNAATVGANCTVPTPTPSPTPPAAVKSVVFSHSEVCGAIVLTVKSTNIPNGWRYGLAVSEGFPGKVLGSVVQTGSGTATKTITLPEDSYNGSAHLNIWVSSAMEWDLVPAALNRQAGFPAVTAANSIPITVDTNCIAAVTPPAATPATPKAPVAQVVTPKAPFEAATGVESTSFVNGWLLAGEVSLLLLGGLIIGKGVVTARGRK